MLEFTNAAYNSLPYVKKCLQHGSIPVSPQNNQPVCTSISIISQISVNIWKILKIPRTFQNQHGRALDTKLYENGMGSNPEAILKAYATPGVHISSGEIK
jgi:hypothetical protein